MDARVGLAQTVTQPRCVVIRPNRSSSASAITWLLLAYAGFMTTVAAGFALVGAWMVMPFAGLEVIGVGAVFYYLVYRHGDDHELVLLDGDSLRIVKREGRAERRYDFQRYWVRVTLEPGRYASYPSRLVVGSHGRFVEIAATVREEQRQALARRLRALIAQTI